MGKNGRSSGVYGYHLDPAQALANALIGQLLNEPPFDDMGVVVDIGPCFEAVTQRNPRSIKQATVVVIFSSGGVVRVIMRRQDGRLPWLIDQIQYADRLDAEVSLDFELNQYQISWFNELSERFKTQLNGHMTISS